MHLQMDGIIFSLQRHGGISVLFRELLLRLGGADFRTTLSLEQPLQQDAPPANGSGLSVEARPARTGERFRACRPVPAATVFHSTYYRLPAQRRLPTVVTVHDFAYERCVGGWRAAAHRWLKHAAIRQAQAIVCVSQATRDDLLEFVGVRPGQSLHVVYNGVSENYRPLGDAAAQGPPGAPCVLFVLFVGQRGRYKNFALAAAALEHLPGLELHCVGGGPLAPAETAHVSAAVRSRIRHLGAVDDARLNALYNAAVCLLYPSAYEGFGIPVAEAQRAGCPVVGLDTPAVREVGGAGLTVAAPHPAALAEAVRSLLEPSLRAERAAAGFVAAARFSWARHFQESLAIYRALGA